MDFAKKKQRISVLKGSLGNYSKGCKGRIYFLLAFKSRFTGLLYSAAFEQFNPLFYA